MQPNESLYDQKPEEPVIPVVSSSKNNAPAVTPLASRFEYVEALQTTDMNSSGHQVTGHVTAPKSSSFFADFGMDSSYPKRTSSNSSKVQVSSVSPMIVAFMCMILHLGNLH